MIFHHPPGIHTALSDIARKRRYRHFTCVAAVALIVTFLTSTVWLTINYFNVDPGIERVAFDTSEAKRTAVKLFFDQLASIGNLSLALVGVLWAFVLQTSNRIAIRSFAQYMLFFSTNLFLLASFVCHLFGTNLLANSIFLHDAADITAPIVRFWSETQLYYFVAGLFCMLITVFCCYQGKRD